MTAEAAWHDVGTVTDLADEQGLAARIGDHDIAVFRDQECLYAVDGRCPHQGASLAEGLVRDGILTCPLHAWQFQLAGGTNLDGGPGLCSFPVRQNADRILVQV